MNKDTYMFNVNVYTHTHVFIHVFKWIYILIKNIFTYTYLFVYIKTFILPFKITFTIWRDSFVYNKHIELCYVGGTHNPIIICNQAWIYLVVIENL